MRKWPPYAEWDLTASGLLPHNWTYQISTVIDNHCMHTILSGASAQSREATVDYEIPVLVATGDVCATQLPWLRILYEGELLRFASNAYGKLLDTAIDLRSSVNINCLRGIGSRYEAHVDTNPVTGLLFACDATPETGGALVFQRPGFEDAVVWPRKGLFIAFDAREIPHFVSPLLVAMDRISVPMNYYEAGVCQHRPPGLDDRLYTPSEKE
jgi:hypothetical protein